MSTWSISDGINRETEAFNDSHETYFLLRCIANHVPCIIHSHSIFTPTLTSAFYIYETQEHSRSNAFRHSLYLVKTRLAVKNSAFQ